MTWHISWSTNRSNDASSLQINIMQTGDHVIAHHSQWDSQIIQIRDASVNHHWWADILMPGPHTSLSIACDILSIRSAEPEALNEWKSCYFITANKAFLMLRSNLSSSNAGEVLVRLGMGLSVDRNLWALYVPFLSIITQIFEAFSCILFRCMVNRMVHTHVSIVAHFDS